MKKIPAKINKNKNASSKKDAPGLYHHPQKKEVVSHQLQKESKMVREESMRVLSEFERLKDEN